ncbi:hypothetical protein DER45DRAFT_609581 [Fusarium avenaceum]|nr:hypothetical protein DER45DRAFT_609581 [Fusarium avenaceum]
MSLDPQANLAPDMLIQIRRSKVLEISLLLTITMALLDLPVNLLQVIAPVNTMMLWDQQLNLARTRPINRSHVRFVEPDTPLSTECLVQLIFDAYSSHNHANVKIITPLKPEESPKEWPICLKTLSERPWTLCELRHRKIGDLEVVVATKEEHACLLSRDVPTDSSCERIVPLFRIYGQKPDFNQIEEEYGLKVLAWTTHGLSHGPFMDREGMLLPVTCFADGPRLD